MRKFAVLLALAIAAPVVAQNAAPAASAVAAGLSPWTQIESASSRTSVPSIAAIEPSATRRRMPSALR